MYDTIYRFHFAEELPENWNCAPDILSLCSLDRSFLFPGNRFFHSLNINLSFGMCNLVSWLSQKSLADLIYTCNSGEQVHILACLSACKQDTSSLKKAAAISENGTGHSPKKEHGNTENRNNTVSGEGELSTSGEEQLDDVSDGESLIQKEVLKKQTSLLLQKFENSHFFVRISASDDPLWCKRSSSKNSPDTSNANNEKGSTITCEGSTLSSISTVIDRGNFDSNVSGGVARDSVKCRALPNGDIVVCVIKVGNYDCAFN